MTESLNLPPIELVCPTTKTSLRNQGDRLVGDGVSYAVINGTPDFLEAALSVGEAPVHTDYVIARRPYEGFARRTHGPIVQDLEERYFERARATLGRKLDIIDIGCGSSKFLPNARGEAKPSLDLFLRHVRRYVGIDPSWTMLDAARGPSSLLPRLESSLLVRAVAERLPFAAGSFDLVFVKSTLDHCADATLAVSEFHRVLRPGGFLLITLQNFASWQRRVVATLMPARYREHRRKDHHTSPFDPALLRERLGNAGFVIEELREMGYLHLSRYRLAWLENAILAVPHLLAKGPGLISSVRVIDRALGRVAPGLGASMICWARAGRGARPEGATG